MKPKVSIIIPVVRSKRVFVCIDAVHENAGISEDDYEVRIAGDWKGIGCPKMVKFLTDKSQGEMVCFLGDDTIPQKDFLKSALKAMESLPGGWGLVGLNDGSNHAFACHWLAHKKLLPLLDGEFFHTGYKHCYCDNELTERCVDMGRYTFAENAKIKHVNPFLDPNVERDEFYEKAYSVENIEHDRDLFIKRKVSGWK